MNFLGAASLEIFEKKKQRGGTEKWEAEGNREESRDGAFERRLAERERAKRGEENRERRRQESREVGGCRGGGFSWLFDGDFEAFEAEQSFTGKGCSQV